MPGRDDARRARAAARPAPRARPGARTALASVGATTLAGINAPAPPSPFNVDDRPAPPLHVPRRRPRALQGDQGLARRHAQRRRARGRGARARALPARPRATNTEGLVLKAMVPVSVRTKEQRGALGNQVAAMWAPLPVGHREPRRVPAQDRRVDGGPEELRPGRRRAGAHEPRRLRAADDPQPGRAAAGAPAASSTSSSRTCPDRSSRSTCSGRRLEVLYPVVPLAQRQALGIAVMSYDGHLGFGLLGDYDALPDLEAIAERPRAGRRGARASGWPARPQDRPRAAARAPSAPRPRRRRTGAARRASARAPAESVDAVEPSRSPSGPTCDQPPGAPGLIHPALTQDSAQKCDGVRVLLLERDLARAFSHRRKMHAARFGSRSSLCSR